VREGGWELRCVWGGNCYCVCFFYVNRFFFVWESLACGFGFLFLRLTKSSLCSFLTHTRSSKTLLSVHFHFHYFFFIFCFCVDCVVEYFHFVYIILITKKNEALKKKYTCNCVCVCVCLYVKSFNVFRKSRLVGHHI